MSWPIAQKNLFTCQKLLRRNSKLDNIIFLFVLKVASLSVFDQEQLISIEIHLRLKLLEMSSKTAPHVAWG